MYLRTRTWAIISVVCFLAAFYFWRLGEERAVRDQNAIRAAKTNAAIPLLSTQVNTTVQPPPPVAMGFVETNGPVKYRVSNTRIPLDDLIRSDSAVLLRNALIDATSGVELPIPPHLRLQGETKSYVVQSRGMITEDFRSALQNAGAQIVSYVPNNAFLVRVNADGAQSLRGLPQVQSVIAWEPHFKITSSKLLELAFEQRALPDGNPLVVMAFPGEEEATAQALRDLGGTVMRGESSPFGTQLLVHTPPDKLVAVAHVDTVQAIEPAYRRKLANDLARKRVNVSTNTTTLNNHLNLTGAGITVGLNDTGIDAGHLEFQNVAGRIRLDAPSTGIDLNGHGTHVAGTIGSSGLNDGGIVAPGSTNGPNEFADYRGMAPQANLFVQPIDIVTGPLKQDTEMQRVAATNGVFISNNSWGYLGAFDYTFAAASWDAAVRDAVPEQQGSQAQLYVFAAGNSGFGDDEGEGGFADSISAPGTAKNVITVGATEQLRNITNEIVIGGVTNVPFAAMTDSDNQVAGFSGRGNVGAGIEGPFGRFKPDVVAPGVFLVSTRANGWSDNLNLQYFPGFLNEEVVPVGQTNFYFFITGPNSIEARIRILPNGRSPIPFPTNSIYVRRGSPPPPSDYAAQTNILNITNIADDIYYIGVGNNFDQDVYFDIQVVIIDEYPPSPGDQQLVQLNQSLGPLYRFESGTSMATPVVSGMLALMQQQLNSLGVTPSPALMKALLINGARSIGQYDLQVNRAINYQGWGLANITNSLPYDSPGNVVGEWPLRFLDQKTNALVTGQSETMQITINSNTRALRMTLVWTDPPGNPAVGTKLVNDLDLIVTNLTTGAIYVGNTISGDFSASVDPSNVVARVDRVNNVENVYIGQPLAGHQYSVTVKARRVSVHAVHADSAAEIAQDYALVISAGNPGDPGDETTLSFTAPTASFDPAYEVVTLTNSMPIVKTVVGANPSSWARPNSNGLASQWRFFVFENTNSAINTNVAFFTFVTPNMARPRQSEEADIDLYVSTNPALTNFDAAAIEAAFKSRNRGGTEAVVFTNASTAQFYYIGVKSEDQQAAEFGLFGFAGSQPFSEEDENGVVTVHGLGVPVAIPDGSSEEATPVYVFGYCLQEIQIQNIVVTNTLIHESGGDLFGLLAHNGLQSVLNNHRGFEGLVTFIYDDSDSGQIVNSVPTDPPGTLRNFWGQEGQGTWQMTMVDNALTGVGTNLAFSIRLEPTINTNENFTTVTILPNRWFFTVVDVPPDATKLTIDVIPETPGGRVDVYVGRNYIPDDVFYDHFAQFFPPGGPLDITRTDIPPLSPGLYFIGLRNPNSFAITVRLRISIERDLNPAVTNIYVLPGITNLVDDAVTTSLLSVTNRREIADVRVGVRIDHPRVSDLVLRLVSPAGTRVILAENRGGDFGRAYGGGQNRNYIHTIFTDNTNLTMTPIKFGIPPFTNSPCVNAGSANYIRTGPTIFSSGFEDPTVPCNSLRSAGDTVDGWFVAAGTVDLLCTGPRGTAYFGQKWLELNGTSAGRIYRSVATVPGQDYLLTFAYSKNPLITNAEANIEVNLRSNSVVRYSALNSTSNLNWSVQSAVLRAPGATMTLGFQSLVTGNNAGMYIDDVQLVPIRVQTNHCNYYFPEEPLRELRGENAYGIWRLEIWDNRAGAWVQGQNQLLEWQVDFDFANTNATALVVTNGQCVTNRLEGNAVQYFRVDVPINATYATNAFSASGQMVMSADSTTLPTGFTPPDDYSQVSGSSGSLIISTASSPPLRPGRSYFVALRNAVPTQTNAFTFCVNFDSSPTNDLSAVVRLTNDVCFAGSIESTNLISYYMFDASSNAVAVFFDLVSLDGNADLFVKRGFPLPFPGNSIESRNTGTNSEHISVGTGQIPGRWFIGVLNNDVTNVNYVLCAREITNYVTFTNSFCLISQNLLLNGSFESPAIAPNTSSTATPSSWQGAVSADIQILNGAYGMSGPPEFPGPRDGQQYLSINDRAVLSQTITITNVGTYMLRWYDNAANLTNSASPYAVTVLGPGGATIGSTNLDAAHYASGWISHALRLDMPVGTYTLRFEAQGRPAGLASLIDNVSLTTITSALQPGRAHYYRFTIDNATGRAEVRTFNATGNIDLYVRQSPPVDDFLFDYASTRPGTLDESVVFDLLSSPAPLTPGDWYAAVVNRELVDVTYCIEVNQYPYFDPGSIQLFITNGWTDTPPPARYMDLTLIGPDYLSYQIEYSDTLTDNPTSWRPFTDQVSGLPITFGPGQVMYTYRDTPLTTVNPPGGLIRMRFYRVRVVP